MYKSYSYHNMPVPIQDKKEISEKKKDREPANTDRKEKGEDKCPQEKKSSGILCGLETDDIILIAVAILLMNDECDDKLLLLAIAFIFLSDKI